MPLAKVVCPRCGVALSSKGGIRSGQRIVCPKCQESFTVAGPASVRAEEEQPGHPPARRPSEDAIQRTLPPKPNQAPKRRPPREADPDEDSPQAKAGKRHGPKAKPAARLNVLFDLMCIGALVLAGGGIGLYFLFARNPSPSPSQVPDEPTGDAMAGDHELRDKTRGNQGLPQGVPIGNAAFAKLTRRLVGRWEGMAGGATVLYDYRSDGTFSLEVKGTPRPIKATGTWKVTGVGKDSGRIQRTGAGDPSPYFKPNDTASIWFQTDDRIAHQTANGPIVCIREEPEPRRTVEFLAAEAKAVARVQKLGGKLTRKLNRADGPVNAIHLSGTPVSDDDLATFAPLANLRTLDLSLTRINDASLAHLKGLTSLRVLKLNRTPVTDAGLVQLKGLTKLVVLNLAGLSGVTDRGLADLKGLTKLQFLMVSDTRVTGAGLVYLKGMTRLKELHLSGKDVRDEHLVHLKGLVELQYLSLSDTAITDAGLIHLDGLLDLVGVSVDCTAVGDEGLARLAALPNLRTVRAVQSRVTEAGVQRARRNYPQLKVFWTIER